jgi:S-adenosylmethionine:tRNA ribosyltransferase-isomerase
MIKFDPEDLLTKSYFYDLPKELIAQRPVDSIDRANSRLLIYNLKTDTIIHDQFSRISNYLPKNSLMVFNQSKVFPSRFHAEKSTGGKAEIFFLTPIGDNENCHEVLIKARGRKKIGDQFLLPDDVVGTIKELLIDGTFKIQFSKIISSNYLESYGKIPIPPYIRNGESDDQDKVDYQTMYANQVGSVAAPTAGLHFTPSVLDSLKAANIDHAYVTLHVGLGTFRPVSAETLDKHHMHSEKFIVDQKNLEKIKLYSPNIVAVGTTSLRVIESMQRMDVCADNFYSTNIFLHPGINVTSINALVTNFHLPESTLLMLVSSLIGRKKALELYELAVKEKYRFFSYGDAMLIVL